MTSDQLPPMLATSRLSSVQRQSECTRLDVYFLSSKNDIEKRLLPFIQNFLVDSTDYMLEDFSISIGAIIRRNGECGLSPAAGSLQLVAARLG